VAPLERVQWLGRIQAVITKIFMLACAAFVGLPAPSDAVKFWRGDAKLVGRWERGRARYALVGGWLPPARAGVAVQVTSGFFAVALLGTAFKQPAVLVVGGFGMFAFLVLCGLIWAFSRPKFLIPPSMRDEVGSLHR
jgi:hypothetical protein